MLTRLKHVIVFRILRHRLSNTSLVNTVCLFAFTNIDTVIKHQTKQLIYYIYHFFGLNRWNISCISDMCVTVQVVDRTHIMIQYQFLSVKWILLMNWKQTRSMDALIPRYNHEPVGLIGSQNCIRPCLEKSQIYQILYSGPPSCYLLVVFFVCVFLKTINIKSY